MKKTLSTLILSAGFIFSGCDSKPQPNYFAEVPSQQETGLAIGKGDIDNDGDLDLVVGSISGGNCELYRFMNDGKGQFPEGEYFASLPTQQKTGPAIEIGDIDGDEDLDLVVGSINSTGRLYRFRNDGKGNFYND